MAAILGMGMSCRLFTKVREQQGLAYNIFADHVQFTDTGMFSVYAGVTLEKTDRAIESIIEELERIAKEPVGEGELAKAKRQLVASLEMALESNSAVADRLASQLILLGRVKPISETVAEINSVTAIEIRDLAADMLKKQNLRLAIIAPDPDSLEEHFKTIITKEEE